MSARGDRGVVLLNALVMVAALSGVAVLLLSRAEGARLRHEATRESAQLRLYADAYESLAIRLLAQDAMGSPADHAGEAWAQADLAVELDRGAVAGSLTDMQSRFNINWLANPGDSFAQDGWERLTRRLGFSQTKAKGVAEFLSIAGPKRSSRFSRRDPPIVPVGGPILDLAQLRLIPELEARDLDRLLPLVAALPMDAELNLNTASADVLMALIPGLNAATVGRIVQMRERTPFESLGEAQEALLGVAGAEAMAGLDMGRFSVGSDWFRADIVARLGDRQLTRMALIEQRALPEAPLVAYRLDEPARAGTGTD